MSPVQAIHRLLSNLPMKRKFLLQTAVVAAGIIALAVVAARMQYLDLNSTRQAGLKAQTEMAIDDADLTLFVVDAKSGLTPLDKTFGELLRRSGKPVVLVANKSEARARMAVSTMPIRSVLASRFRFLPSTARA